MKGRITIGRVTCSDCDDYVRIEIEDILSSIEFVSIKMSIIDFAEAVLGRGAIPIEFETRGLDKLGKKYKHKIEQVYVPYSRTGCISDDLIDKAVSSWEINGWVGSRRDCKNHHNWVANQDKGSVYNVHFCRWVEVEKEDETNV